MSEKKVTSIIQNYRLPSKTAHKGQNGKLLVIGGSELFHAASAWSLTVASRIVDMVFYSSIPENNKLITEAKENFWNGVVIPRGEVRPYVEEADVVLIGPGMTRTPDTTKITNDLLKAYPKKRWVVDAGALQMANPALFTQSMIITPHHQEFVRVFGEEANDERLVKASLTHNNVTILLKGPADQIVQGEKQARVEGGNEGMTKGGTGDVLAALVASIYCLNNAFDSAVAGSFINKKTADELYNSVGPFFNTTDLVEKLPSTMKVLFGY